MHATFWCRTGVEYLQIKKTAIDMKKTRRLDGFTPAKARLTAVLPESNALPECSEAVNIASATARSTLKCVFKKTQRSGEAEWVKLMFSCNMRAGKGLNMLSDKPLLDLATEICDTALEALIVDRDSARRSSYYARY
ncbi:MAG: hypothetical protein HWE39_08570 [Oceanospirillaceae bacterium]|nr:hypothetical protein [Oceanospirillaceae bacterium]